MRKLYVLVSIASLAVACKDKPQATPDAGSASSSSTPAASTTIAASASAGRPRPIVLRAAGPTGALFRAASTADLKEEQRSALEKLATEFREADKAAMDPDAGARSEMKQAHDDLVAGVKAGKIDVTKVNAAQGTMEKASKARHDREADALNKLHATLEPAQRTAVVSKVREMEEKRAARMKLRSAGDAGKPNPARLRLEHYTKDLGLDAEQQKKVDAMLPKDDPKAADPAEEAKKKTETVLAAFEKETFDAKTILAADATKKTAQPMADLVKFMNQLLPVLKPEQREKLAAKLEKASEGRGRPRGMGGAPHEYQDDDEFEF